MARRTRGQSYLVTAWLAGIALLIVAGCPGIPGLNLFPGPAGPAGPAGPQGPAGPTGIDAGNGLPGTVVTILNVNEGAAVNVGDTLSVTFTLKTKAGRNIPIDELDRFSIHISGPAGGYQRVITPKTDGVARSVSNDDGSYTYIFESPFPSTFAAPYNDSDAFAAADGEMTGMPIADGTYSVGLEARRTFTIEGAAVRDAGDAYFDFLVGAGAFSHPEIVTEANCERCHNQITVHGENRFTVAGCRTCHTAGGEDRTSSDPAKATTGVTIDFAAMIHAIHRGSDLPTVRATANGADPHRYEIIGFGESVIDFSDVKFPMMPGGTGFNQQTRNCGVCHDGAANGDRYYNNPSRSACGSCHNDLNFNDGTHLNKTNASVNAGTLTKAQLTDPAFRTQVGGIPHAFGDSQCSLCHVGGTALGADLVHRPILADPAHINGINMTIQSVLGASGALFMPGDFPVIAFNILNRNDNPLDMADVASVSLVISGPVDNLQKIIPTSGSSASMRGAGGVPTSGTGPFTYTSPTAIPATYSAPQNDSADFTFADGWGELSGQPLVGGTYMVYAWASRNITVDGVTYREVSPPAITYFNINSAGAVSQYPGHVTDAKCNACHGDLRFHGNGRKGAFGCATCHVAGAEDRPNPVTGQTQAPEPDTIDWKVMIHKIHAARDLSVVRNGGAYDLIGFAAGQPSNTGNVVDFSTGILPSMPLEARDCTACHATDAWKAPIERSDVAIWKVACTSCHDSQATAVHVQLNTLPGTTQEACSTCHGPGRSFAVDLVHAGP